MRAILYAQTKIAMDAGEFAGTELFIDGVDKFSKRIMRDGGFSATDAETETRLDVWNISQVHMFFIGGADVHLSRDALSAPDSVVPDIIIGKSLSAVVNEVYIHHLGNKLIREWRWWRQHQNVVDFLVSDTAQATLAQTFANDELGVARFVVGGEPKDYFPNLPKDDTRPANITWIQNRVRDYYETIDLTITTEEKTTHYPDLALSTNTTITYYTFKIRDLPE